MNLFFRKFLYFCRDWNIKTVMRNIKFLACHDMREWKAETIEDCIFEFDELRERLLPKVPRIMNTEESLSILETQPKSFARVGDGELDLLEGKDLPFQKYDPVLAEKIARILKVKRYDLYVGIVDYFRAMSPDVNARRKHLTYYNRNRRYLIKYTTPEILYLNAGCFLGYFGSNYEKYGAVIERKKKLFEGRKIAIVTGESVKAKWDYDVFELAASKQFIHAPSKNAFQEYASILNDINRNVSKDTLVCLILGQTATAMAADLTDMGYMAWDIGHLAKDYDAYMKKEVANEENMANFWDPD